MNKHEQLFWQLADELLEQQAVTRSTMMGYPCVRNEGAFFACIERGTGHLIVKLPADRVNELIASKRARPFAPNGRTFREWAAIPTGNRETWSALLKEAQEFTTIS
jgi:hypothetical protein